MLPRVKIVIIIIILRILRWARRHASPTSQRHITLSRIRHRLLAAFTSFANVVLSGLSAWRKWHHFFLWTAFVSFEQKVRDIWPIAVGVTVRRLASKCEMRQHSRRVAHSAPVWRSSAWCRHSRGLWGSHPRHYIQTLFPDHVTVKLDFVGAFDTPHRSEMLLFVGGFLPELYAFCLSSYLQPSFLYFRSHVLLTWGGSTTGYCPVSERLAKQTKRFAFCAVQLLSD